MDTVLIAGYGDIGRRVAERCRKVGRSVYGLCRSKRRDDSGVIPVIVDLDDVLAPGVLPPSDSIYYFAPPPGEGETDPRVRSFLEVIKSALPKRIVYISTSAVYGDCAGEWIDETAPLNPGTARGRRRLDAENALREWSVITGVPVVILRVPGIYAHDRLPEARLKKGLPVMREEDSPFTNRIHADDLAAVCVAAMARGQPGAAYNVSDGHPTTMCDYFSRVADYLGLPRPPQIDLATAERELSRGMMSFMRESKRLQNKKMRRELGVSLRYPSLVDGLNASERY